MSKDDDRDDGIEEQADVEQQPDETAEQVTEETHTEQTHGFDKGLQKVQQDLSTFQRTMQEQIEGLTDRLESASTPAQQQVVRDEIDDLMDSDDLDLDSNKALRALAGQARSSREKFQQYDSLADELRTQNLELQQQLMEMQFRTKNPELDYDGLLGKAQTEFKSRAKGIKDPGAQRAIWQMIEERVINEARAEKAASQTTDETESQPKSRQGTRISASSGTGKAKPPVKARRTKPLSEWRSVIFGGE